METKKLLSEINERLDKISRILDTITIDLNRSEYVSTQEGEIINEEVMRLTAAVINFGDLISVIASTKED